MPYGPREIGRNRQLALPADLLEAVRLAPGDQVFVALADDPPGALLVLPVDMVVRWIDRGLATPDEGHEDAGTRTDPSM